MAAYELIRELLNGISIDDFMVYAKKKSAGRFAEESDLDIYIKRGDAEAFLLQAKIFLGRKPYYLPWTEIFNINNRPKVGEEMPVFFDSIFENRLLDLFSKFPDDTGDLFIEYNSDTETAFGLRAGYPAAITRLGFKLFQKEFTWFKDWYFPEGHMEGGQKLQGEKSASGEARNRQLKQIHEEIREFLANNSSTDRRDQYLINAISRAEKFL